MSILSLSPDALARRLGDEMVIVHLADEQVYTLSETAARCWELLAAGTPTVDLPCRLAEEFDVDVASARRSLDAFISSLRCAGLLREASS